MGITMDIRDEIDHMKPLSRLWGNFQSIENVPVNQYWSVAKGLIMRFTSESVHLNNGQPLQSLHMILQVVIRYNM